MNDYSQYQAGDIVLVKNYTLLGWMISKSFHADSPIAKYWGGKEPKRPSMHNGIIGRDKWGILGVFESQPEGFIFTSLEKYETRYLKGECELMIVRFTDGLTDKMQRDASIWLNASLGRSYDYKAYCSLIWRTLLRLPAIKLIQSDSCFYCTEAVKKLYDFIDIDFMRKKLPTPFTIEKRVASGALVIVDKWVK